MHDIPIFDYLIHFGLEALGGLIAIYAYNFCQHRWHKFFVWLSLSALTTVLTVQLVG